MRVLNTQDNESTWKYLAAARKHHSQREIAQHLNVDVRTVRRWELRQTRPPAYVTHALQALLPFQLPIASTTIFDYVDLFAGTGGLRIPFDEISGRCVFTCEWDSYALKTYSANFPASHLIAEDITKVRESDIPNHDLLLAGFPCQPFSIAGVSKKNALGRAHGFADKTQGTLFFDIARIIAHKRPRVFLLENVKNLQSHNGGRTFQVISDVLAKELGYKVYWKIIDAAHFLPQHRERILIVGFRETVAFDWSILNLPDKKLQYLDKILHRTDGTEPVLPHDGNKYFDHDKQRVNQKYTLTTPLWKYLKRYAEKHRAKGNGFGFGLVGSEDITRTLSARYYKDGSEILVRQAGNPRRLTPRECARLMGFPDSFKIPVSDTRAYKQFGNAVAVPVIREVARILRPFICDPRYQQPDLPNLLTQDCS